MRDPPARLPLPALFERGLICRADDRGDPVIQISPPLVAGQAEFDEIVGILGEVLEEAGKRMVDGAGDGVKVWLTALCAVSTHR